MRIEKRLTKLFNLTGENWLKHANPLSVYSRYSVLPLLVLALWSRLWLDVWSLIPICFAMLWLILNPILFSKPKSTKNWASQAVLGERVYLNRNTMPLPSHHTTVLYPLLNSLASLGFLMALSSTIEYSIWLAVAGISLTVLAKSWFLDRMVWLYRDMKDSHTDYSSWDY